MRSSMPPRRRRRVGELVRRGCSELDRYLVRTGECDVALHSAPALPVRTFRPTELEVAFRRPLQPDASS
jgi:hypothetical protein